MATSRTVVIAGAGIGGLTASLALAKRGFRVVVMERAGRLEEAGAGLQLSPNASRLVIELGLEPLLAPHVIAPNSISITTARTGREVGRIPSGAAAILRYGGPYWIVRRADLHPRCWPAWRITPISTCGSVRSSRSRHLSQRRHCRSTQRDRRQQEPALALIGADGVWSTVRHQIFPRSGRNSPAASPGAGRSTPGNFPGNSPPDASTLDGDECAYRRLSDVRRTAHQRGCDHIRQMEPAGLERARRRRRDRQPFLGTALADRGAHDDRCGRQLAQMGAVRDAGTVAHGARATSHCWATRHTRCCRLLPKAPGWRSRMPRSLRSVWRTRRGMQPLRSPNTPNSAPRA